MKKPLDIFPDFTAPDQFLFTVNDDGGANFDGSGLTTAVDIDLGHGDYGTRAEALSALHDYQDALWLSTEDHNAFDIADAKAGIAEVKAYLDHIA